MLRTPGLDGLVQSRHKSMLILKTQHIMLYLFLGCAVGKKLVPLTDDI